MEQPGGGSAPSQGQRTVECAEAVAWLTGREQLSGCSVITSLPDVSEFPTLSLAEWKQWFVATAALVMARCPRTGRRSSTRRM